jgi:hypothetical protein
MEEYSQEVTRKVWIAYLTNSGPLHKLMSTRHLPLLRPECTITCQLLRLSHFWNTNIKSLISGALSTILHWTSHLHRATILVPVRLIHLGCEGEPFGVKFSPEHRWKYVQQMNTDKVMLIKWWECISLLQKFVDSVLTPIREMLWCSFHPLAFRIWQCRKMHHQGNQLS